METITGMLAAIGIHSIWPLVLFLVGMAVLFVALALFSYFVLPALINFLNAAASRVESEKIRTRLHDAIGKFNTVAESLMEQSKELVKKETLEIIADGKIEREELIGMARKMAELATKMLMPEQATFKKYFAGEQVMDLFTGFFTRKITEFAQKKLGKEITVAKVEDPF